MLVSSMAAQLSLHAGYGVPSISSTGSARTPVSKPSDSHSLHLLFAASGCMDPRRHAQDSTSRRVRPQQSRSSLQGRASQEQSKVQAQSSPLPQTQWSSVPLPYRPRDLPDPADRPSPVVSEPRPRRSITGSALSGSSVPDPLRPRRRPQGLRDAAGRSTTEQATDTTLLYPGMSPYADRLPVSAPADLPRSVSQPNSPSYFQQRFQESEPPFMHPPRSPTYPPAGRRRMHSASGVTDAAFADEQEFRLFVDATAGLGPEQAFRHNANSPNRAYDNGRGSSRYSAPDPATSPEEQTPTTMRALQQLASMPQASSQTSRQRLQTSAGGLDLWLQPPSRPLSAGSVSPYEDELPPDDELPDYASSQAQAQAHQRAEAARRAQELQRRWHESGSRRGT